MSDCTDSEAASEALAAALTGPKRVKGDAGEVEQRSIDELIKADQYLAAKCASSRSGRGLRITKLIPGGTA